MRIFYNRAVLLFAVINLLLSACSPLFNKRKKEKTQAQENITADTEVGGRTYIELQHHFFNANREKVLGDFEKAIVLFNRCIKIDPKHDASYFELAKIYLAYNKLDVATQYAEKAYAIDSDNKWYALLLADLYSKGRNYKEAARINRKLIKDNPYQAQHYFDLATVLIYDNKLKEAAKVYDQLEEITGITEEVSLRKKRIYQNLNNTEGAIDELQKLIARFPNEAKYYSMLAEIYQSKGDNKKALETYAILLEKDPDNPYVLLSMANYYEKSGEKEKAFEMLERAFAQEALGVETKLNVLVNYYPQAQKSESLMQRCLSLSKTVAETHPADSRAHAIYGDYLYNSGNKAEAVIAFKKSVEIDKNNFMVWNQLVILHSELDDFKNMEIDSKQAMELFPTQPLFYWYNGIANSQLKNYGEATKSLNAGKSMVIDNKPLLVQFYSSLGDAHYNNKEYDKSYKAYENALALDENNLYVLNNYSYYLSLRSEHLEKAEKMSKKTIEKEPFSASYLDTHAWVLYKMGKYTEAKKMLEKAMEHGGENQAVIVEHYGDVLYKLNDTQGALEYWKKAQEKGEGSEFLIKKIESGILHE
jgi:tetratricopeptide (TPR) repeat protein